MRTIEECGALPAAVLVMVGFNAVFLSLNGVFMLVAPLAWYELVPGVTDTGFYNQHFIRDIGIVQLFLGVAFALGLFRPARRIGLWAAATAWLIAHALFHFWEVAVGICAASAIPRFSRRHPAGARRHRPRALGDPPLAMPAGRPSPEFPFPQQSDTGGRSWHQSGPFPAAE
ncbi:MAG: hypothetical protein R3D25_10320 [Geminicoccaceae bacterium]